MDATEAKAVATTNKIIMENFEFNSCLQAIKKAAQEGKFEAEIENDVSDETKARIKKMGYSVNTMPPISHTGKSSVLIKW